nr:MAG TPA: hypothetical protein [Caudoviricetes sp.]
MLADGGSNVSLTATKAACVSAAGEGKPMAPPDSAVYAYSINTQKWQLNVKIFCISIDRQHHAVIIAQIFLRLWQ